MLVQKGRRMLQSLVKSELGAVWGVKGSGDPLGAGVAALASKRSQGSKRSKGRPLASRVSRASRPSTPFAAVGLVTALSGSKATGGNLPISLPAVTGVTGAEAARLPAIPPQDPDWLLVNWTGRSRPGYEQERAGASRVWTDFDAMLFRQRYSPLARIDGNCRDAVELILWTMKPQGACEAWASSPSINPHLRLSELSHIARPRPETTRRDDRLRNGTSGVMPPGNRCAQGGSHQT